MFKSIVFVVAALAVATASPTEKKIDLEAVKADAGAWVDQILTNVRNEVISQGMNRYPVPNFQHDFYKKWLIITYHGTIYFRQTSLTGLDTIHRSGVADITTEPNGDLVVKVDVALSPSRIGSAIEARWYLLDVTGAMSGTFSNLRALITVRVKPNLQARLEDLYVVDLGSLSNVDVSGLGFTGIYDFMAELAINTFDRTIVSVAETVLQGPLRNILVNKVNELLFPGSW